MRIYFFNFSFSVFLPLLLPLYDSLVGVYSSAVGYSYSGKDVNGIFVEWDA